MSDKIREEFESWWKGIGENYLFYKETAWEGFRAGRDRYQKELSEQTPIAYVLTEAEARQTDGRTPVIYIGDVPKGSKLIILPEAPKEKE